MAKEPGQNAKLCLMGSRSKGHWEFRSAGDVSRFWDKYRTVPGRIDGRKHHHEKYYCLGLYLLALADHDLLTYPLSVEEGEFPDFMVTWPSAAVTALEVIRATEESVQRAMTENEKEFRTSKAAATGEEPEPVSLPLSAYGWGGDQAEAQWCSLYQAAIAKKVRMLSAFKTACWHDLLLYDETPLPVVDRQRILSVMQPYVESLQRENPKLGKTSFIVSLDVLYDVGGEVRSFRYVEPPNLDDAQSMKSFSERSEYAGRVSAEKAVRDLIRKGIPVYSSEGRGRVVKQTADGRRFQVRFREDGEEVIVKELSHR
jgi:hypothetical protein